MWPRYYLLGQLCLGFSHTFSQNKRKKKSERRGRRECSFKSCGGKKEKKKKWVNSLTFIPPNYPEILSPAFVLSCCNSATETKPNIQIQLDFLKVLCFSFLVPVVGPSAKDFYTLKCANFPEDRFYPITNVFYWCAVNQPWSHHMKRDLSCFDPNSNIDDWCLNCSSSFFSAGCINLIISC